VSPTIRRAELQALAQMLRLMLAVSPVPPGSPSAIMVSMLAGMVVPTRVIPTKVALLLEMPQEKIKVTLALMVAATVTAMVEEATAEATAAAAAPLWT